MRAGISEASKGEVRGPSAATEGTATASTSAQHNLLSLGPPVLLTFIIVARGYTHSGSDGGDRVESTGHLPFSPQSGQDLPLATAAHKSNLSHLLCEPPC